MTILAQGLLFLSSYAPLFGVFALLDTFGKGIPTVICIGLAGWAGVLLLQALFELGLLSKDFATVWEKPVALSLAMAAVLGFSERLFGKLITATEKAITPTQ